MKRTKSKRPLETNKETHKKQQHNNYNKQTIKTTSANVFDHLSVLFNIFDNAGTIPIKWSKLTNVQIPITQTQITVKMTKK